MSPAARIRAARVRELDRLAALFGLLLEHHASEAPRFALRPGSEDALRDWLAGQLDSPDARVLVAECDDALQGLCVASVARRPALFRETERGGIDHLIVRPEARRRGLGRALAEHACAWLRARGVSRVEVQVDRGNPSGGAFWRTLGFAEAMDVLERPL